jgi:hypothetical protein
MPIPTPTRNCPINNIAGPLANALAAAPAQIIIMSASINGFRPKWSAIGPPSPAPNTAPSTRLAPMRPTRSGVRWNTAITRGIATPRTKIAKPSSSVPPVDSTQSHRWIPFSGDASNNSVRRWDSVISPNVTASCAGLLSQGRPPHGTCGEFRPGSRLVSETAFPSLPSPEQ